MLALMFPRKQLFSNCGNVRKRSFREIETNITEVPQDQCPKGIHLVFGIPVPGPYGKCIGFMSSWIMPGQYVWDFEDATSKSHGQVSRVHHVL
ncbi:hypothetical protein L484_011411 [Morus notabilis]|uniref:Uncharacterized protein n=1 Tax=Morus notabilis TaxID=981085 RepID=W9S0L3_9ROSA|nr:hypothetical protein L484_011411 [Morus notabilis]